MPTATTSAKSDSSKNQPMMARLPDSLRAARRAIAAFAAALLAAGCVSVPPAEVKPPTVTPPPAPSLPATYRSVAWSALPGWGEDRLADAWSAFRVGCRALVAPEAATRALWEPSCSAAATIDATDGTAVRAFFEGHFSPWQVVAADGGTEGTVTGYYEPLLAGSRTKTSRYAVPLFAAPEDLLTVDLVELYPELKGKRVRGRVDGRRVVPYWARADIEAGKPPLDGKAIAFVEDPVDAFFLQIQGSGRVALDDGSVMRVGYADQNGRPFKPIARVLIERGELAPEKASMQAIRAWGRQNPDKLPALLDENPSYVFFREVPAPAPGSLDATIDGPIGTLGVPLLAERTIAVDPRAIPLGAPVYLATTYPLSTRPLARLVLAQDTGGAIRGALRADFFWGFGDGAGREAGRMKQDGRMWILWPKEAGAPKITER
jgi:membrane-bound lytic murein transglycosylase A